jgi:hypothetical protein
MKIKKLKSWLDFQAKVIAPYCAKEPRPALWFRGQSNSTWPLKTTLDRFRSFSSNDERLTFYLSIMNAFGDEIVGIKASQSVPDGDGLELLARHHGLPSALLDWSRSPYVASYFAFESALQETECETVAIWVLNCQILDIGGEIELIEDRKLLRYNQRALEQAGVFIRVNSIKVITEELLGEALTKYEVPSSEAKVVMRYLEAMNTTASSLFRDLDGAARAVKTRVNL